MHDALCQAVRPVIVEDLDVTRVGEGCSMWGDVWPAEAVLQHEVEDRAVRVRDVADELAVATQLGGGAVEAREAVGTCGRQDPRRRAVVWVDVPTVARASSQVMGS